MNKFNIFGVEGKTKKIVLSLFLLCIAIGAVAAYAADPGSEGDPVVTKSYVDNAIRNAISRIPDDGRTTGTSENSGASYQVVKVKAGERLLGDEGTEIILRSGKANAIDNGSDGISDLTGGRDLRMGDRIKVNHLLLVPRTDGRGLSAITDTYLMVRGSYILK